jgi:isoleucyl-tRNA synthetase
MLPFTMEEAWLERYPQAASVHLEQFRTIPAEWRDEALAEKWKDIRQVRRVVTGALELERANKGIGSSLEAVPVVTIEDEGLRRAVEGVDLAEIAITSGIDFAPSPAAGAFTLDDVAGVAVTVAKAEERGWRKCARSWRYTDDVGSDTEFPDVSARDAAALRELKALRRL